MISSSSPYKPTDFAGALASLSDPAPDADVPRLTGDASAVIPGSDLTEGQFAALPPEEQKRHRRLIRNRLSAHLHRQRQRGHIDAMEAQVLELALVADEMRERLGAARAGGGWGAGNGGEDYSAWSAVVPRAARAGLARLYRACAAAPGERLWCSVDRSSGRRGATAIGDACRRQCDRNG